MSDDRERFLFDAKQPASHIDDYVHGLLTNEEAAIVRAWCDNDEQGQQALAAAERRKQLLMSAGDQPELSVPGVDALVNRTVGKIDQQTDRRKQAWRVYRKSLFWATAASIALIAGFQFYFSQLAPSPYDIRVIGQAEWMAGSHGSLQVFVMNVDSGEAVEDVPLRLKLTNRQSGESVTLASFRSGAPMPRFDIPDWEIAKCELQVEAELDGRTEVMRETVEIIRPWKLLLTTDKPMYQPGRRFICAAWACVGRN